MESCFTFLAETPQPFVGSSYADAAGLGCFLGPQSAIEHTANKKVEGGGDGGPLVGIGVDATNGYSTLSLGYEGEFGDQIERHSLNVAVRFRF